VGNLIDAARAAREDRLAIPTRPRWCRRLATGAARGGGATEVIAKSVLSFDIAQDGSVLYTNGSAIHRIGPGSGAGERIAVGKMIEQVAAL